MSREQWASAFGALATAYWTPEREDAVTGGKDLPLLPGRDGAVLRALGLLQRDASMPPREVRKYRQVNHMVAMLRPGVLELAAEASERGSPVHLVDAACGRSYLTLALAWWLSRVHDVPVRILGVDRQERLLQPSRRRAEQLGMQTDARFLCADLSDVSLEQAWTEAWGRVAELDGVVSLHACDTATDHVLASAVRANAKMIAAAPCCQAELSASWHAADLQGGHALRAIYGSPSLRRDFAATTTDAMRAALLEEHGYRVSVTEFVGTEHSAKNTLLRARRTPSDPRTTGTYAALKQATGGHGILLERLLA